MLSIAKRYISRNSLILSDNNRFGLRCKRNIFHYSSFWRGVLWSIPRTGRLAWPMCEGRTAPTRLRYLQEQQYSITLVLFSKERPKKTHFWNGKIRERVNTSEVNLLGNISSCGKMELNKKHWTT